MAETWSIIHLNTYDSKQDGIKNNKLPKKTTITRATATKHNMKSTHPLRSRIVALLVKYV